MSAVISQQPNFTAFLTLGSGVTAHIQAPTLASLSDAVTRFQPAANDTAKTPDPASTPKAEAGNALASTATPASAPPAASGSADSGEAKRPDYNDVRDRVLKLAKISRDTASGALAKFGVDHGNKLPLEKYTEFLAHADGILAAGAGNA